MNIVYIRSVQVEKYLKYEAYKQAQKWPFKAQLPQLCKSLYLKSSPHAADLHVWYGPVQLHILQSSVNVFLMMMETSGISL
jgi:hypothetical protein